MCIYTNSMEGNNKDELEAALESGDSSLWSKITLSIMDSPHPSKPVEERHNVLASLQLPSTVKWTKPVQCSNPQQLRQFMDQAKAGVILQKPGSLYVAGGTSSIYCTK